jgi:hypothetical protein
VDDLGYQSETWLHEKMLLVEQAELLKAKCEEMEEIKR